MLLWLLGADEKDMDDVIENENTFQLSEMDELGKRTVILRENELAPEPSTTSIPPPQPAACNETNGASPHNADSSMSESTLTDTIIFAIMSASMEKSRVIFELSKALADLPTFNETVSEWIAFRAVYIDTSGLFRYAQNIADLKSASPLAVKREKLVKL
ncbi:hypothetical protein EVAR_61605_1 [Eumeta japonica]|uniref:Uncharacterized protein n=1 Tax=Eumeta variegata TaxID=151549 RepID=A0A4C1SDU8_EUMVA|nr:hypothetical protein EVAR_61605_1 [Eumeta japonica]